MQCLKANPYAIIITRWDTQIFFYRSKIDKKNPKPLFTCNYFNCKKQGHQAHECRMKKSEVPIVPRLEVNYYIYQKYGHRTQECIYGRKN